MKPSLKTKLSLIIAIVVLVTVILISILANLFIEEQFNSYLDSGLFPDVDLLIRTSGEYRISNFLLWKIAYAELAFIDEAWPELTPERFTEVVNEFSQRDRRFGGLK